MAAQDLAREFQNRQPFVYQIHGEYVSTNNGKYYQSDDDEKQLYLQYREEIELLHGREYNEIKRTAELERLMRAFKTLRYTVAKNYEEKNINLNNLISLFEKCNDNELADVVSQSNLFFEAAKFESEYDTDQQHNRKI